MSRLILGPLLDSAGRLIGINTAIYSPGIHADLAVDGRQVDSVAKLVARLDQKKAGDKVAAG